jgi:type IV pilus assembly protein PilA
MKNLTKNSSGFTLVELMVVVAIIGILSAIAVPNFKKYQNKSKQSEAKIQLASVYTTEVSAQADYDAFGTCLSDLGYEVTPRGYYMIGFAGAYTTGVTNRGAACTSAATLTPSATGGWLQAGSTAATAVTGTAAVQNLFTAGASGSIKSGSTATDQWTITEAKSLLNSTPDI